MLMRLGADAAPDGAADWDARANAPRPGADAHAEPAEEY